MSTATEKDTNMNPPSPYLKDETPPLLEVEEDVYLSGVTLASVLGSLVLVVFLLMLDTSIVGTAIPKITTQFHSLNDVGWYGSAYLLSNCSLQPLTGKIYSRFQYKYTFIVFFAIFELGSLLCAISTSSTFFIVGRAVAGMGCSGLMNGAISIVAVSVPLPKRPMYIGIIMAISQFGILFGPLIGGALTQYTSWRWCFYINLPCGAVAAVIIFFAPVPDGPGKTSSTKLNIRSLLASLDLLGFALFAPAIIQFLLALEWGGMTYAWNSATVIGLFCGGGVTLGLFIAWEYFQGDKAMIPLAMVKQRIFWSSCFTIFFTFANMMCINYYLPMYFQAVRNTSPTMSGVDLLPSSISQMLAAITSGRLVMRLGYYLPFSVTCGVLMAISNGLLSTLSLHTSTGKWICYQIIGGFGRGLGIQMPIVAVQNLVPKEQGSVAMSLVIFSQTFGGALFLAFAQTVFNTALASGLNRYAPNISAAEIQAAGATGVKDIVSAELLPAVLKAYSEAVSHVFYLATGAAVGAAIVCLGMGWKSIKPAKKLETTEA